MVRVGDMENNKPENIPQISVLGDVASSVMPDKPAKKKWETWLKRAVAEMPNTREKITICLAETIGTGLLLLFGCMGCVGSQPHLNIAIGFGLTVMFVIQTFGHISGAHLNPAVTIAAVVLGHKPVFIAPFYIVSQVVGALLGFGILKLVTPFEWFNAGKTGICTTEPALGITVLQALMVEYLASAVLIFVCCGVWDARNSDKHDSTALRFGFAIAALAIVSGPYTGCSMNPARSFGPALWNNNWTAHWIYWVGPLMAAFTIAGLYRVVFTPPKVVNDSPEDLPLR